MTQLGSVYQKWNLDLQEASRLDAWGQIEEAAEKYNTLGITIDKELKRPKSQTIRSSGKLNVVKLKETVKLRAEELKFHNNKGVGIQGIKTILQSYSDVFGSTPTMFPLQNIIIPQSVLSELQIDSQEVPQVDNSRALTQTKITIIVHKWGFKNPSVFLEPAVIVSVVDQKGSLLEKQIQTSISSVRDVNYVHFNDSICLQTPLEKLKPESAIFFEFKHYKSAKRKHSIKCYSFLERDEIKEGTIAMESYKKPADYSRTVKPRLFTIKNLFLYVDIKFSQEVCDMA